MKLTRIGILALCSVVMAGCAGMEVPRTRGLATTGTDFTKQLYQQYLALAEEEYGEYDMENSDVFAVKAQRAAKGEVVLADEVSARNVPANAVAELTSGRQRLMTALNGGGREHAAMDAARAQVMWDCWIEEQEENTQPTDIARCRTEFLVAMVKVEGAIRPAAAAAPAPAPVPRSFLVLFANNSSALDAAAEQVIQQAAAAVRTMSATTVRIVGHTDTSGQAQANFRLSERRAQAVSQALTRAGVGANLMGVSSMGENQLVQGTADNMREARNRRVEITISR